MPPTAPTAQSPRPVQEFDIIMPEGLTVDRLAAVAEGRGPAPDQREPEDLAEAGARRVVVEPTPVVPVAETPTPKVPAPEIPAPASPPPKVEPKTVPLATLIEERKRAQERIRDLEEKNRLLRRTAIEKKAAEPQKITKIVVTAEEKKQIKDRADKAEDPVAAVAELTTDLLARKTNEAREADAVRSGPVDRTAKLIEMEDAFIAEHPAYDEVLFQAGMYRRLESDPRTGLPREPALYQEVYQADNPIAKGYELAVEILRARGRWPLAGLDAEGHVLPMDAPARVASAPAPTAETVKAAEDRARAEGAAAATADARGRGIRSIPNAGGPPKARIDKAFLDRIMETDYDQYLALCKANPNLELEHMSA